MRDTIFDGLRTKVYGQRQEFVLLSDTLAVSTLVDLIAHSKHSESTTVSTVLGPFYREGAPE